MNSVAMCTYNGEKYIKEQLQSIINQTMKPDEIVICDDCSKDATVRIINETLKNWTGLWRLIINEKNLGFQKNFQKAMSLCNGDIIYLSDQDDVWDLKKMEIMNQTFREHPRAVLVFHDATLVNEQLQLLYPSFWDILDFEPKKFLLKKYDILFKRNILQGSACALKKMVFTKAIPFPNQAVHDEWLLLVAISMGDVIPIPQILMKYRQGNNALGGLPESGLHRVKKWTVSYKNTGICHYDELLRRSAIFNEYEKRNFISAELEKRSNFKRFSRFLQYRLNCINEMNVLIIKTIFQYKYFFLQWPYSIKALAPVIFCFSIFMF